MATDNKLKIPTRLLSGALCMVTLTGAAAVAADSARTADVPLEEISVTASRIVRSGFNAPTPTTIVGAEMIEQRGAPSVADLLNEIPSFSGSVTPSSSNTSSTQPGANFVNLRGLGISRTLVLVNGRRHVPTAAGGEVDLNAIPTALVDRVEIVTGGASAAWGSDAVAGVVNLIMKDDLDGFSSDVQYGRSERGDNEEGRASLAFGTRFADDRGRFSIAAEYSNSEGIDDQTDRDWGAQRWAVMSNPDYTPTNGQPARLIVPGVTIALASPGGLIIAPDPLSGISFGPGGTVEQFQYGSPMSGLYMVGDAGGSFSDGLALRLPVERKNVFARMSFDLSDSLTAYTEGSVASSESESHLVQWPDIASIPISADNAYLPASVRPLVLADGIPQPNGIPMFVMGRINDDFDPMITAMESRTWRAVAGLTGRLAGDWTWDAYYQRGQSRIETSLHNNRVQSRFFQAIDAVTDPVSGAIVCRSTLTNPADGCVPFNVFGQGSTTRAAYDYVRATQLTVGHRTQSVAAVSFQGTAFSNWAGPVSIATGAEYRKEEVVERVDELSAASAFIIGNPQALAGSYDVKEAFLETVVPLLADKPLARSVDLSLAGRFTDYSTSGEVTTWKAGVTWNINDTLRLRGTRSRDIRAPNLPELYTSTSLDFATVLDPLTNGQYLVQNLTQGNLNLQPEEADTTSFGVVYEPSWLSGLRASIDYFNIEINGAIGVLGTQDIVDRCDNGAASLCPLITRDPVTNQIASVVLTSINLNSMKTSGFDVEASYGFALWGGDVSLRLLGTYVSEKIFDDGQTAIDQAGQNGPNPAGGVPDWVMTAGGSYRQGPFSFYLEGRYLDSGKFNNSYGPLDINDNTIPSVVYVNTSARYTILDSDRGNLQLFGVINNLLDKDPPIAPVDFAQPSATNVGLYDVIGRNFSVGARYKF